MNVHDAVSSTAGAVTKYLSGLDESLRTSNNESDCPEIPKHQGWPVARRCCLIAPMTSTSEKRGIGVGVGVGVGVAVQANAISTTMDSKTCTTSASDMEVR
jgi:hypothetical protein